jgi:hypothetical protein
MMIVVIAVTTNNSRKFSGMGLPQSVTFARAPPMN